jgi:putative tricarboxylic transport membrane protein
MFLLSMVQGFVDAFTVSTILSLIVGVSAGIVIGAIPGLTATMSIAVITPLTFGLSPSIGITMLLGVYVGGIYGGSITAILLRTPGTPSSIATTFDGYPLVQQGNAGQALYLALVSSVIGGIISAIILIAVAPQIARVALKFGPEEMFGLTIFGLSVIATISSENLAKGLISGLFGLLLSTVGLDIITGVPRFTFGNPSLMQGLRLIPVLIGLFALPELFDPFLKKERVDYVPTTKTVNRIWMPFKDLLKQIPTIVRSSLIGTFIGIIPGTGGAIAAFLAYDVAKKSSKEPERFGKGAYEGISSAESANNATTGGALVPMLTLGIPGDASTAVLISAFMIQGMRPGPLLFKSNSATVYMLLAAFFLANLLLYGLGMLGIRLFAKIANVPAWILSPIIFVLCLVGSYSVSNSLFDVGVMLVTGFIGFGLLRLGFPTAPIVIGLILGPMNERALRQAITGSQGKWITFLQSPICVVFLIFTLLFLLIPLLRSRGKTGKSIEAKK